MFLVTIYNKGTPTIINSDVNKIASASVVQEKNAIDSFTFTIYPSNPVFDSIVEYTTTVKVVDSETGAIEFEGRAISNVPEMSEDSIVARVITCEGLAGYLNDSTQGYLEEKNWPGHGNVTGLQEFVDHILDVHNSKVEDHKKIYRGIVDMPTFKSANSVTKGTNFESTYSVIADKLIGSFGGEWRVRRDDDGDLRFDYREHIGSVKQVPISVGRNMASGQRTVDPNQLITRLYPRGCKLTKEETDDDGNVRETETEERLSIAEVNGGVEYIDDDEAIARHGIIEGVHEWDDVTDPSILLSKAQSWHEDNNALPVSTTLTGYDLSYIGLESERFNLLDWYPCYNPLIDLDETLEIVRKTLNFDEPYKSSIDFGETTTRQSINIAILESLKGEVEVLKSQSHTTIVNLDNYVRYTMSSIEIAEDRIVSTVGEQIVATSDELYGEIEVVTSRVSQVEQTADSIIANVSALTETQEAMQSQLELLPNQIISTVEEGYTDYVDGKIAIVTTSISEIDQKADSISASVTQLTQDQQELSSQLELLPNQIKTTITAEYTEYVDGEIQTVNTSISEIQQTIKDITLSVEDGELGSTATIKLGIGDDEISGSVDLTNVRQAFRDDDSYVTISAGRVTFNSGTFVVNSTYFKVTSTGYITATSGKIGGFTITSNSIYNDVVRLTNSGLNLDRDGVDIGSIGTNNFRGNTSIRGLVFDLEYTGSYMTWAAKRTAGASSYTVRLIYANKAVSTYSEDTLNVCCELHVWSNSYWHNYIAHNFWIDPNDGGVNGGPNLNGVRLYTADGTAYWTVNVKHGLIV